jgi:hypothetical protein
MYTAKNYASVYDRSVSPMLGTGQLNGVTMKQSQSNSRWLVGLGRLYIAAPNYVERLEPLQKSWIRHLFSLLYGICCSTQGRGCHCRSTRQFCQLQIFRSSEWTWAAVQSLHPLCSLAMVERSSTPTRPITCVALS